MKDDKFYLMCKNKEIAKFNISNDMVSNIVVLEQNLLPEILKINNSVALHEWLKSRSIDVSRSNARLLLKLLKLSINEISPVLYNQALNLTDCYWIRKDGNENFENLSLYRKGNYKFIIETSLSGIIHELQKEINTELTNIGSFNKAWVKENNQWWLYKRGNQNNNYAELFTYYLGNEFGMNIAEYKISNGMVISKNFTDENNMLEHYGSLKYKFQNKDIDDVVIYNNLKELNLHKEYADILLLDSIVCNPDRHEYNFGVIKDSNTGNILKLAPNFDNNLSLGASSSLSTYLLKMYLKEIGIQEHQYKYINKLCSHLVDYIDKEVRCQVEFNTNSENIKNYFIEVLKLLK